MKRNVVCKKCGQAYSLSELVSGQPANSFACDSCGAQLPLAEFEGLAEAEVEFTENMDEAAVNVSETKRRIDNMRTRMKRQCRGS